MFYYSEDGKIFKSKIEALEHNKQTQKKIFFYYYDDIYDKVNWTIEPPESLDYYYKAQAQKIRDTYDYVILCYSGGYDSSNILETFYYNNIKLDKIVTVGALSQDSQSGVDENHNGELYHNVFPYLKQLGLESITQVIDFTKYFDDHNNFSILKYGENWVDQTGGWFSPHNWFWYDLEKYVVPREFSDKKVAIIFGKDKPSLYTEDLTEFFTGNLDGFYFRDTPCTSYGNVTKFENCDRINFYWDPNFPEILVKQLHVLKRHFDIKRIHCYSTEKEIQMINNLSINDLVYNLKRPLLFKSPKSKTNLFSLRDNYLLEKKDSSIYQYYQYGVDRIQKVIGGNELNSIMSKFYRIA